MANVHKGSENLIPLNKRTKEEQRAIQVQGGKASGKSRGEKKTFKQSLKIAMDEQAPDKIKQAFEKNGYDVNTHREAITAAILMGAMQGNPKMLEKVMEFMEEDFKLKARQEELKIQRERLEMEKEKAELEKAKAEALMEALKSQQDAEMEDDGFIEALKGTAKDDWSDYDD